MGWQAASRGAAVVHTLPFSLPAQHVKVGMTVLGVVRAVNVGDLTVTLPFNLTGKVPATEALLPDCLERVASLADAYTVGMPVTAVVTAVDTGAKKVHLSLLPSRVNAGLDRRNLGKAAVVWGMVASAEDHGYTVNCGPVDARAFLPFTAHDGGNGLGGELAVGGPILACVTGVRAEARGTPSVAGAVSLSCTWEAPAGTADTPREELDEETRKTLSKLVHRTVTRGKAYTLRSLKAGNMVSVTIVDTVPTGLVVKFLGYFTGTVSLQHLPTPAHTLWYKAFKPGDKLKARVLFVDAVDKRVALSAAPHMLGLTTAATTASLPAYGEVQPDATVLRVDRKLGVLVGWGAGPIPEAEQDTTDALHKLLATKAQWGAVAYVHISRVGDGRISNLEKQCLVGTPLPTRITGSAPADGVALGTSKPSVVSASILRVEDVAPGSLVTGQVLKHTAKGSVFLDLGGGVKALATRLHLSDTASANAAVPARVLAKLAPDTEVQARVLTVDTARRLVMVTLKPTLVQTPLQVLTSYPQAAAIIAAGGPDEEDRPVVHAFVSAVRPAGIILTAFGNVHGLVPKADLEAIGTDTSTVQSMAASHPVGRVVQARLVHTDAVAGRLTMSLQLEGVEEDADAVPEGGAADLAAMAGARVGSTVSGAIVVGRPASWAAEDDLDSDEEELDEAAVEEAHKAVLVLRLPSGAPALLPVTHTSDDPTLSVALARALQEGEALDTALVVGRRKVGASTLAKHGHLATALQPALAAAKASGRGQVDVPLLSLKPLLLAAALGQRGVLGVGKADAEAAAAEEGAASRSTLLCPTSWAGVRKGALVAGYVSGVTSVGAFIQCLGDAVGLAPPSQLSDALIDSPEEVLVEGQTVLAVVSSTPSSSQVNLDTRPSVVTRAMARVAAPNSAQAEVAAQLWAGCLRDTLVDEDRLMRFMQSMAEGGNAQGDASGSEEEAERAAEDAEAEALPALSRARVPVGAACSGVVRGVTEEGVAVRVTEVEGAPFAGEAFVPAEHAPSLPGVGDVVTLHVLDLNIFADVIIGSLALQPAEAPSKKRSRKSASGAGGAPRAIAAVNSGLQTGQLVTVTVGHIGRDARYASVLVPVGKDGADGVVVGLASLCEYSIPLAGGVPDGPEVGSTHLAMVTRVPSTDDEDGQDAAPLLLSLPFAAGGNSPPLAKGSSQAGTKPEPKPTVPAASLRPGQLVRATVRNVPGALHGKPVVGVADTSAPVALAGVTGVYTASLPLSEAVEWDPYTGRAGSDAELGGRAVPQLKGVFARAPVPSLREGQKVLVKVVSVRVAASGQEGSVGHVHIVVTARHADVDAEAGELASHRPLAASQPGSAAGTPPSAKKKRKSSKRGREAEALEPTPAASAVEVWAPPLLGTPAPQPPTAAALSTPIVQSSGVAVPGSDASSPAGATEALFLSNTPLTSWLRYGVGLGVGALGWGIVLGTTPASSRPEPQGTAAPGATPLGPVAPASVLVGIGGGAVVSVPVLEAGIMLKQVKQVIGSRGLGCIVPLVITGATPRTPSHAAAEGKKQRKKKGSHPRKASAEVALKGFSSVILTGSIRLGLLAWHELGPAALTPAAAAVPASGEASTGATAQALATVKEWMRTAGVPRKPGTLSVAMVTLPREEDAASQGALIRAAAAAEVAAKGSTTIVPPPQHAGPRLRLALPGGVFPGARTAAGATVRQGFATVDATHSAEPSEWRSHPFDGVPEGTLVQVALLRTAPGSSGQLQATLRPTLIAKAVEGGLTPSVLAAVEEAEVAPAHSVGAIVKGYVASTTPKGCFVRLTPLVTARVLLSDLSDGFVKNTASDFPPGKLVTAKVKAFVPSAKAPGGGRLDLSLRPSDVSGAGSRGGVGSLGPEEPLPLGHVFPGQVWTAVVRNAAPFGVFVNLCMPGSGAVSTCRALAHVSEVGSDEGGAVRADDLPDMYSAGDKVQVVVLGTKEDGKVAVSMDPEKVAAARDAGGVVTLADLEQLHSSASESGSGSDSDASDSDDEEGAMRFEGDSDSDVDVAEVQVSAGLQSAMADMLGLSDRAEPAATAAGASSDEGEASPSASADSGSDSETDDDAGAAAGTSGFDWGTGRAVSDSEEEEEEAGAAMSRTGKKTPKTSSKRGLGVAAAEARLADDGAAPETADDFERLVTAEPGKAFGWIRYMAWHVSLTDMDAARAVAERAVAALRFREPAEKLSLWLAYLNLEAANGDDASFKAVYKRALASNDPETVQLKVARIHEERGRPQAAEKVYNTAVRKYGDNPKLWLAWAEARFRAGNVEAGRSLLERALRGAHKRHHTGLVQRFALLEMRSPAGSVERGRTLMEGLLASAPSRLDLWFVFVDAEVKAGNVDKARALLERLTASPLGTHKMKSALNKFMALEREHGDEAGQAKVARLAQAYIARLQPAASGSESGSESDSGDSSESSDSDGSGSSDEGSSDEESDSDE